MKPTPFGIKTGWWSFGLEQSLPIEWWLSNRDTFLPYTYSFLPYEHLPPLRAVLDEDFQWLKSQPVKAHSLTSQGQPLAELSRIAHQVGVTLPSSFTTFLGRAELHQKIRSNREWELDSACPKDKSGRENG